VHIDEYRADLVAETDTDISKPKIYMYSILQLYNRHHLLFSPFQNTLDRILACTTNNTAEPAAEGGNESHTQSTANHSAPLHAESVFTRYHQKIGTHQTAKGHRVSQRRNGT
jgi:hypothetical protein